MKHLKILRAHNVLGNAIISLFITIFATPYVAIAADQSVLQQTDIGQSTEQLLPERVKAKQWIQDQSIYKKDQQSKIEIEKVEQKKVTTKKLKNVVPAIRFQSGKANIPEEYVEKFREILHKMRDRANVRLHFIGYTDNIKLRGKAKQTYGDNLGLSKERAGTTAEFFQRALSLPAEAISYEGFGESNPVADNATQKGRALNRRVEVQVWYDEISKTTIEQQVEVQQEIKRIQVCRVETVCKIRYKAGHSRRSKLKNLVPPFHYEAGVSQVPNSYLHQLKQALQNLKDKQKVQMRFVGHTDNNPLIGRDARIYGDHLGLSKAHTRRFAQAVQEAMKLTSNAVSSTGKGASSPLASNNSEKGRALNRRIEVEFWHDDPLEELTDEPQICPEASAAETVERIYNPPEGDIKPMLFKNGKPILANGYTQKLTRAMNDIKDKGNVRLRFIGYTSNERLDRRTAMVYGDDIGLSTARARRAMQLIKKDMGLTDKQVEFEGHGYVQSHDVVNTGFLELDQSKVEVQIVYDDLALLDDSEGLLINRFKRSVETKSPYALNLMRISVDGQPINDPNKNSADLQRCTDVALDKAQVQFKFDNLRLKPRLNVSAWPNVISHQDNIDTDISDNRVNFKIYSNYPAFIKKAEIRIFASQQSTRDTPLLSIPVDNLNSIEWDFNLLSLFAKRESSRLKLKYLLRVYDKNNRFDETKQQTLWVIESLESDNSTLDKEQQLLVGYGENRLSVNNIKLDGGTVSILGSDIPKELNVWFAGYAIPLNENGKFASELILPQGRHTVEVAITDQNGNGNVYLRDMKLKNSDWFYVGIADLTLSQDNTNGPAQLVTNNQSHYDNDLDVEGRLAFYIKGKFSNQWKITSSADTREGPVKDLFSNFMNKSPDALFRRIDPDYHYPSFGDDSTVEEDAPTSGKFYLKLEKDKNHVLWGNFELNYMDNNLTHVDRKLYGINFNYESDNSTAFGEKRFISNLFAAQDGTVAGRDEFRSTGGSLYYLRHQDILRGSERIRVEVRDAVSGLVSSVKNLIYGLDYDIDYIQGRLMLNEPLALSIDNSSIVSNGDLGSNQIYLVSRYEYSPSIYQTDKLSSGGRVHYWFNDFIKLGVTAENQAGDSDDAQLGGVDITFRKNAETWLKLESSTSRGLVSSAQLSDDGGFRFNEATLLPGTNIDATGERIDISLNMKDLMNSASGKLSYYHQRLDAGYAAPGLIALTDVKQEGINFQLPVGDALEIKVKGDSSEQQQSLEKKALSMDVSYRLNDHWKFSMGAKNDKRYDHSTSVALTQIQGVRTDIALKADYLSGKKWNLYSFLQDTAKTTGNRDENARIGLGGDYRSSDRFKIRSELSSGDLGTAIKLGTDYKITDSTNIYNNYTLENERSDTGVKARKGNLTSGFKSRYSDNASIYMEEKYTHGEVPTGLTHSMGLEFAPSKHLNLGANVDAAVLINNYTGAETNRLAVGLKLAYKLAALTYAGAVEYRIDESEQIDTSFATRTSWLIKNSFKYLLNPSWRIIGKINHSQSESSLGDLYNGNFTEAVLGYAYRPIEQNAINALFKYTYFYNLPATDQVSVENTAAEYIQKSHILSLDFMYDLTQRWSIGGKYAHRLGQLSQERVNPQFFSSEASLYIARVDWHVTHHWDMLMEQRLLILPDAQDQRSGSLIGIYRHMNEHFKLGIGYNFTSFSDDLTDLDYDSQGYFINLIGKF